MSHPARSSRAVALGVGIVLAVAPGAAAQERGDPAQDSVRLELRRLATLVDSLRAELSRLRAEGREAEAQDALAALRAAAEAAAEEGGARPEPQGEQEFQGRQRSLQALNPEISLNADVLAHVGPEDRDADNFFAREFELSIISNLDPFSRAKVFIGRHVEGGEIVPFGEHASAEDPAAGDAHAAEAGHGEGFAVEEGYVEWVGLPGGLGLKLGRFYQQFGQINRWHSHAMPFQSRPLPHMAFFGEEGLGQTGASLRWLAPFGGDAGTYEVTLEATRSENPVLYGESGGTTVLGSLNSFWQLSRSTDLDVVLSWAKGTYEDEDHSVDRSTYGAEASLTWRPPAEALYRGFNLRTGVLVLDGLVPGDTDPAGTGGGRDRAMGFWSWGELRLSRTWLVGARYEWTENPEDTGETAWLLSPTLTWWQSEYVRLRAEYDLLGRIEQEREGRFLLQVTFAVGPHKHESY